ncbi:signal peptidase I [Carnimonas nigrificans]|uniref:signal peptidase I n=1 Tax=Carnimonas nigrificans TaxID=64323 RepID=UPI0004722246|nr:signal peptidase I [Carnimonas nigrificans]
MNFSLILVIAVVVTGVIWLLDKRVWRKRRAEADPARKQPWYVDYSRSFFPVLLFVLVVRSFIVEPFQIPSGSMEPTLDVGDFITVNKFSYGLRLPVLDTKIIPTGEPKRGDVVVFRYPVNPEQDFIKRVIGLPGDHIRYQDEQLYINGEKVDKTLVSDDVEASPGQVQYQETLPSNGGEVRHQVYNTTDVPFDPRRNFEGEVPEGHYFVMGDNRDNSADSRFWGFVPEGNLVGRASFVWMHWRSGLPSFSSDRVIR